MFTTAHHGASPKYWAWLGETLRQINPAAAATERTIRIMVFTLSVSTLLVAPV
jgi:hypothetical protein